MNRHADRDLLRTQVVSTGVRASDVVPGLTVRTVVSVTLRPSPF